MRDLPLDEQIVEVVSVILVKVRLIFTNQCTEE